MNRAHGNRQNNKCMLNTTTLTRKRISANLNPNPNPKAQQYCF